MYMPYLLRDLTGFLTPEENLLIALSQAPNFLPGGTSKRLKERNNHGASTRPPPLFSEIHTMINFKL